MRTLILACAVLLAGCASMDERAEKACVHLKGTDRYGDCYAQAYQNITAAWAASDSSAAGAAMMGAGAVLLSTPPRTTTTCLTNRYTGVTTCY